MNQCTPALSVEALNAPSIYIEAVWVLALFASTALMRSAVGEINMQWLARGILACSHIRGRAIDIVSSCTNGGRSLGFAGAFRLWNVEPTVLHRYIIVQPLIVWLIGMPVKLIAVSAVRGGSGVLGYYGTWALGGTWIALAVVAKVASLVYDRTYGVRPAPGAPLMSFRRVFQLRFCQIEGFGMMLDPELYDATSLIPKTAAENELGVDIEWQPVPPVQLTMKLTRRKDTLKVTNGIQQL